MDFVNGTGIHRPGVFTGFEGRIMGEDVIFQHASHLRFFSPIAGVECWLAGLRNFLNGLHRARTSRGKCSVPIIIQQRSQRE